MSYAIVEFVEDNCVDVVPSNWLAGDFSFWPAYRGKRLLNAVHKREEPNESWSKNKARVIRSYSKLIFITFL